MIEQGLAIPTDLFGDPSMEEWAPESTFTVYVNVLRTKLENCDLIARIVKRSDTLAVILLGESDRSRLIAVSDKDLRGIIYALRDDGTNPDPSGMVLEPERAFTYGELTREGYSSIVRYLQLQDHANDRLAGVRATV